jgi:hypothetical protein
MNSTALIRAAVPVLAPILALYAEEHHEFLKARRSASTRCCMPVADVTGTPGGRARSRGRRSDI